MYGDKRIFFAENLNEVYIVDIQNNEIEVYEKTIFQQKLSKFISSIYFDGSFYCFQWVDIKSELHFSIRGEDEFFGPLIRKEKLYYNNELTFLLLKLSSILMVIIGALFFIRNYIKNRDKIFIYKDQVKYRGAVITDNEIKAKIIRLLLITDGFVSSSQIMDICENKNQNYAHNTRVKNALIEKINYILKSALKIKADIIISKLSVEDKRIKVYEIDKSYFVLK